METKTVTISKHSKPASDGKMLKMVVAHTPAGKNRKGKQIYHSQTRHVPA